jgi:hypothetical protein
MGANEKNILPVFSVLRGLWKCHYLLTGIDAGLWFGSSLRSSGVGVETRKHITIPARFSVNCLVDFG